MKVTITADTGGGLDRLAALGTDAPRALTRALKRTGAQVRTAIVRAVAADTGLTQAVVRKATDVQDATFSNQVETVTVSGRRIPLFDFKARQTARGVSYRLPGGRGSVPSAFITTMRSGHVGVFARRTRTRLPIVELFGPSLPHVVRKPEIIAEAQAAAIESFTKNLDHEVEHLAHQAGLAR